MQCSTQTLSKDLILTEARTWLRTPFKHQGRRKGVGVDCAGLLVGVARACGMEIEDYTQYDHNPNPQVLREYLHRNGLITVRRNDLQVCDILQMKYDYEDGKHLAMVTDIGMIHAAANRKMVVEHVIDSVLMSRVVSIWRWPWLH